MRAVDLFRFPYLGIYVNCFHIAAGDRDILVDSGLAGGQEQLRRFANSKTVLLSTHGHWDHIGNHRFLQKHGVQVYANPGDQRYYADHPWHWQALFGQFENDFRLPEARKTTFASEIGEELTPDFALCGGQVLVIGDKTVEGIETPGHSAGSICFLVRETGDLFTGDTLMGNGFFGGFPQYTDSFAWRQSMERLAKVNCETVYCDHNEPMPGNMLREKALLGIARCEELGKRVRSFARDYRGDPKRLLAETAAYVAGVEGKSVGGGLCVTVLTHLREMGDTERTMEVFRTHVPL